MTDIKRKAMITLDVPEKHSLQLQDNLQKVIDDYPDGPVYYSSVDEIIETIVFGKYSSCYDIGIIKYIYSLSDTERKQLKIQAQIKKKEDEIKELRSQLID